MNDLQFFPVRMVYDTEKDKWHKKPAIPKGVDWHEYRATIEEIEQSKNIGIVIPKGLICIDVDTQKGVTTDDIEAILGCELDWDSAEVQRTVSGGMHYFFSVPEDRVFRQGSDLLDLEGFDTRTTGKGWIASGEGYEDLTLSGLPGALEIEDFPPLPGEAIRLLDAGYVDDGEIDDLELMIAQQPLEDISLDDMKMYLDALDPRYVDGYDSWFRVGLACYHQTHGGKEGLKLWAEWSKQSKHFNVDELRSKWKSFKNKNVTNPITFSTVIKMAGGKSTLAQKKAESLYDEADNIETRDQYFDYRDKVKGLDNIADDMRGMIAAKLAGKVGKEIGLSKTEIKKAIQPEKKKKRTTESDTPEWCADWVYIEKTCEFANTELNYAIKREAFNAKFDRMNECLMAELSAAQMALTNFQIDTVVDSMYWPGADKIFQYDGMDMLNAYHESGIEVCDEINEDGQSVIDMFLKHIEFTLRDEREQRLLLDWLAYVYQNPGRRINWAMLLQGTQGTGKSYFVKVLQLLMGDNVRNLDPMAIAGRFTGWAHGATVVAIEEIRISGTNKYEVLDRMKPFITNDTVQIEEKGRDHRTVPNFTNYLMLTNHKDAIPLTSGDRRYCVLFSRIQSEKQLFDHFGGEQIAAAYFSNLFDETKRRADAIGYYLANHKISESFNPVGRAPETNARKQMMDIAVSPERLALEDAIHKHSCDVINDAVLDVTWLNNLCEADGDEIPTKRALTAILLEMGYEQVDGRRVKIAKTGSYHYVWVNGIDPDDGKTKVREFHNNGVPF